MVGLPRPALAAGAVRCRKMLPEYVKEIRPPHAKPHGAPRHAGGSNGYMHIRINGVRPGTGDAHQTGAISWYKPWIKHRADISTPGYREARGPWPRRRRRRRKRRRGGEKGMKGYSPLRGLREGKEVREGIRGEEECERNGQKAIAFKDGGRARACKGHHIRA